MEIKLDVPSETWRKFEQLSGDIGRNRSEVFAEIVEKAWNEAPKAN